MNTRPLKSTVIITLLFCSEILLIAESSAQVIANPILPEAAKKEFVTQSLNTYWKAIESGAYGPYQETENEKRDEPLIPEEHALRIVDNAAPVGVAMWCNVDWRPYYIEYMAMERRLNGWDETQNRYIGVLFGFTQRAVYNDFERSKQPACSTELHYNTSELMRSSEQAVRLKF